MCEHFAVISVFLFQLVKPVHSKCYVFQINLSKTYWEIIFRTDILLVKLTFTEFIGKYLLILVSSIQILVYLLRIFDSTTTLSSRVLKYYWKWKEDGEIRSEEIEIGVEAL